MSQTTPATKKIECFSMTGYAQARAEQDGWAVRVSVKSVNHRFLDLKLRLPEGFDLYDLRLRQIVRECIHRGHLEIYVNAEPATAAPVQVNKDLAQAYLRARSEEHTSELQSQFQLVCRLLLEKKRKENFADSARSMRGWPSCSMNCLTKLCCRSGQ